jgi:predicted enzyme related to lactoylglutathione lyase
MRRGDVPEKLIAVVIEAHAPTALARFWADALGWQLAESGDAVHPTRPGTPSLLFVPAATPKTTKNRLHLDLAGSEDAAVQRTQVQRLLDLGAEPADIGQGDVPWDVLADPEGNEFCVLREPGTDGHLVALCQDAVDPAVQGPFWTAATGWSVVAEGAWGFSLRALDADQQPQGPRLVMGPPAAPKTGVNRWRFAIAEAHADADAAAATATADAATAANPTPTLASLSPLHTDPEGNDYHLTDRSAATP